MAFLALRMIPATISFPPSSALASMRHALPLLAALLLAGCSTVNTHLEPKVNLAQLKHVFVQQNLNDNHGLDLILVGELQARGIKAESGPMTLMPQDAEAYLTYQDQ